MHKLATLDLIAKANGLPTTDELRAEKIAEAKAKVDAELAHYPLFKNSHERKMLRKLLRTQAIHDAMELDSASAKEPT